MAGKKTRGEKDLDKLWVWIEDGATGSLPSGTDAEIVKLRLDLALSQSRRGGKGKLGSHCPLKKIVYEICARLEQPNLRSVLGVLDDEGHFMADYSDDFMERFVHIEIVDIEPKGDWRNLPTIKEMIETVRLNFTQNGKGRRVAAGTVNNYITDYKKTFRFLFME